MNKLPNFLLKYQLIYVSLFALSFFTSHAAQAQEADSILTYINKIEDNREKISAVYDATNRIATVDPVRLRDLYAMLKSANADGLDKAAVAHGYTILGQFHAMAGQSDSILFYRQKAVNTFRPLPGSVQKATAYNALSSNYYYMGELETYLAYNDSAYLILKGLEAPPLHMKLMILFNRTPVLFEIDKGDESLKILRDIERQLQPTELDGFKGKLALRFSYYYRQVNLSLDSSIFYAKKAVYYFKVTQNKSYAASSYSAIGSSYSAKEMYKLAEIYLDSALQANSGLNDHDTYVSLQYDRMRNYLNQSDFEAAKLIWQTTMDTITKEGLDHWRYKFIENEHLIFELQGDFKTALAAHKKFKALDDSLKSANLKETLAEMDVQYEVLEKDAKLSQLEVEQNEAKARLNLMYLGASLSIVILLLVLFFTRRNYKLNKRLTTEKQKTLQLEVEKKAAEEARLKSENEQQKKQLSTRALEISQRNRMLHTIYERIEAIKHKEPDSQKELINMLYNDIRQYLRSSEDWKRIRVHLEEVNSVLIKQIEKEHPQLTTKDLRLLMLFKIGLDTKEIASLLNLAPKSVKMSRYRLKKKLDLGPDDSLETFVNQFENNDVVSV